MRSLLSKIAATSNSIVPIDEILAADARVEVLGSKIQKLVGTLFNGSLAIREVDAGSDNACENELNALTNAFYDIERFGIHFVASPRHADMLMVTGPVSRNMAAALQSAYDATPNPKVVVAVGDDAIDGGIYKGSYATYDGVSAIVPVDYTIAGDPPSPLQIMAAVLAILQDLSAERGVTHD